MRADVAINKYQIYTKLFVRAFKSLPFLTRNLLLLGN